MKHVIKRSAAMLVMFAFSLMACAFAFAATADAASVKLNHKSLNMAVAVSQTLKVKGTNAKVTWSTSNKSVATVDSKGKVTAIKKGTATITAKVGGKKKLTCKVTVSNNTKVVYKEAELRKQTTWEEIQKTNETPFCSVLAGATYNKKGELKVKVAVGNMDKSKTWTFTGKVLSVRLLDKKGRTIAAKAVSLRGSDPLKPKSWNAWVLTFKGSEVKKVIDLRNTQFSYDIEINTL